MGPRRAAVPILMLVSTSACATGGARSSSACSSDLTPSPSSVSAVLDSAAVASGLQAVLAARTDLVLATVTAARDDGPRSGQIFAEGLEDSDRTRIREILEASNRLEEGSDERVRLVLRDEAGIRVRRVDRFAQCAPRIRNRPTLQRRIAAEAAGLNIREQMVVRIFAFVGEDGVVGEVRIDESSGDPSVDLAAARVFRGVTFTPAVIEGITAPVWVAFPVTFTPRGSRQGAT